MKCYVVETSSGSYEDYFKIISRIFLSKPNADKFAGGYNENLAKEKAQAKICGQCVFSTGEAQGMKQEDLDFLIEICDCNKKNIECWHEEDGSGAYCTNPTDSYWVSEGHRATVREFELYE